MLRIAVVFVGIAFHGLVPAHGDPHAPSGKIHYGKAESTDFGRAADPAKAKRIVHVEMSDNMRFTPAHISVKQGERSTSGASCLVISRPACSEKWRS